MTLDPLPHYPSPMYEKNARVAQDNVANPVRFWLQHGMPGSKIVVGIPNYARTWKLTPDSELFGTPPLVADGPGAKEPYTNTLGFLSYSEVCPRFIETVVGRVRRVNDSFEKYGKYAYRGYHAITGAAGSWIGYEDPETAGSEASYARAKGLGGVAIFDLSTDDFRDTCNGENFPIMQAVKNNLSEDGNIKGR